MHAGRADLRDAGERLEQAGVNELISSRRTALSVLVGLAAGRSKMSAGLRRLRPQPSSSHAAADRRPRRAADSTGHRPGACPAPTVGRVRLLTLRRHLHDDGAGSPAIWMRRKRRRPGASDAAFCCRVSQRQPLWSSWPKRALPIRHRTAPRARGRERDGVGPSRRCRIRAGASGPSRASPRL